MESGVQLIYSSSVQELRKEDKVDGGHCRICGGDLYTPVPFTSKNPATKLPLISDNWTDEANICDPSSAYVCQACQWFLTRQNRMHVWRKLPAMVVEPDRVRNLGYRDFRSVLLSGDFDYPVVLSVRGGAKESLQKHTQWRANRCISYASNRIKVAMTYMYVFAASNGSKLDAIAQFDLHEFQELSSQMEEIARQHLFPYLTVKKEFANAHSIINALITAFAEAGQYNEIVYLASYLTGYHFFPCDSAPAYDSLKNDREKSKVA